MKATIADFGDPVAEQDASPDPERVLAGSPKARARNHYTDAGGQFFAGSWAGTAGRWKVAYTEHEFCHLLEGRVVLTSDDGCRSEFGPGDTWVIPAGFSGTWETVEPARKLYAIFDPGPAAAS